MLQITYWYPTVQEKYFISKMRCHSVSATTYTIPSRHLLALHLYSRRNTSSPRCLVTLLLLTPYLPITYLYSTCTSGEILHLQDALSLCLCYYLHHIFPSLTCIPLILQEKYFISKMPYHCVSTTTYTISSHHLLVFHLYFRRNSSSPRCLVRSS